MNQIKNLTLSELMNQCEDASNLLKSMAHPQRLQILCHLSQTEMTVGELEKLCGASQSAVSQFLGRMKLEGLVSSARDGQFVRYRIKDEKVLKLIQVLHKLFCP